MRWLRLGFALLRARFRSSLSVTEESVVPFRVWLTDVDASVMNHAAMMTVIEMGRIDLMVRLGFFSLARKSGWYFPTSSISVQFLRPLKLFQKGYLTTRVFHACQRWVYIEHKITRRGRVVAICVVRSTVKQGRETIPVERIAATLGIERLPAEGGTIIQALEHQERLLQRRLCDGG